MLQMLADQTRIENSRDILEESKLHIDNLNKSKTPTDLVRWKFLDQVTHNSQLSDSDQQLLGLNDVGNETVGTCQAIAKQDNRTKYQTILSNGMALTSGLLNVEILSQPIVAYSDAEADADGDTDADVVDAKISGFQFTTPTSTFQRKKQLQIDKSNELSATWTAPNRRIASAHINGDVTVTMLEGSNTSTAPRKLPVISTTKSKLSTGATPKHKRKSNNNLGQMSTSQGISGSSSNQGQVRTATMAGTGTTTATGAGAGTRAVIGAGQGQTQTHGTRHRTGVATTRTATNSGPGVGVGVGVDGFVGGIETYLGLIGWRKKCLYTLLLLLMLLIITNLVLTLWILKVMEFSTDGMGQLKIVPGGIQLSGQAIIMDMLRASTIRSRYGQPISIESSRNFSINTRDSNGMLENHLFLGHDKFECLSSGFRINDTNGRNLFSVNRKEVTIGAHALRIDGEGGAIFRESVQTPHVRADPGRELRLESPTRQLEMTAAKDINLQSRAGGMEIMALEDVKFRALDGSLRLESSKILMPNLRTAQPPILGTAQSRDHLHRVFQLCACSNGKLFLAAPHSICAGDDSTVCR